ncbi:MAG: WYL domain-containing transcriptional regulator [Acidobacteria bacterium]|nr:WYL domain-containing transcriptional regulator [Acidobacteriota bacterium]
MNVVMNEIIRPKSRVYLRALARVARIHVEIARGSYPSISTLARLLEVNQRTVKRDLAVLRDSLNAPLKYNRRRKGYCFAVDGWLLPVQRLTEGDLLSFFIAENALRLTGQTPHALQLKSSLAKIASLLPEEVIINLASLGETISFQNLPYVAVDPNLLNAVAACALSERTVEFDYYSPHSQRKSHRRADIHILHNFAGDWFAVSFDHQSGEFRDFHVGRMTNFRETGSFFEKQKSWHADEYLQTGFSMMRGGRLTSVEIHFDAFQAQWIRERHFFHPEESREELPDGSLRLSFKIGEKALKAVARFCLTYSGHCRAEKPNKLKALIREKLRKGLSLHV